MKIQPTDALVVVDVQNDFCPGGALPVNGGDQVVPGINPIVSMFSHVFFTRDWHPEDHCSFADPPAFADGSWPPHCVADTPGAEFQGDLHVPLDAVVISKGTTPDKEAYSGFEATGLAEDLRNRGVERIFVCGLATEYCVKSTALDGLEHGFAVVLVENACRGVDTPSGTADGAVEDMKQAGVMLCLSGDLAA